MIVSIKKLIDMIINRCTMVAVSFFLAGTRRRGSPAPGSGWNVAPVGTHLRYNTNQREVGFMKKIGVLIAIFGVLFMFVFGTCSASGKKEREQKGAPGEGKPPVEGFSWRRAEGQTLNILLNRHPWTDSVESMLPEFEKLTGITLKYDILTEDEYMEKLLIDLSMKTGRYDVFMAGAVMEWQYSYAGWIKPLDAFLEDPDLTSPGYDFGDFFDGIVKSHRWDGKIGSSAGGGPLWAIPIQQEVHILFYNKWLLDELGLKVPTTYPEMEAAVRKATTTINGEQYRGMSFLLARSWPTLDNHFLTPFSTLGGRDFGDDGKSAINSPESVEIHDRYLAMVRSYGPPGVINYTWYDQQEAFSSGKYLLFIGPSVLTPIITDPTKSRVADKVGFALPPRGMDGDIKSHVWTWGLSMNARTKKDTAAWLFMQWSTSKEVMLQAAINGNMDPPRQSSWNAPEVVRMTEEWGSRSVVEEVMQYAQIRFTPHPLTPAAGDRWAQAMQEIYLQEKSAQQALDQAARDIDQMVAEQLAE
jgi:multiple sugar transport system substrate-binding protein